MKAVRTGVVLKPDISRVLFRPFEIGSENRILKIIGRVCSLTEDQVDNELKGVLSEFESRHKKAKVFMVRRFNEVKHHMLTDEPLSENRQLLIGAYFTSEYSLESAALFNPSMVWAPDQSNLPEGAKRFIVSLRATGEGHISSIVFRSGIIYSDLTIGIDSHTRYVNSPLLITNKVFDKQLFENTLFEMGHHSAIASEIFTQIEASFSYSQLQSAITAVLRRHRLKTAQEPAALALLGLAASTYEIHFSNDDDLSERIIFPNSPNEMRGIEDARFVAFEDRGEITYYATYTAYNGVMTYPQIIETVDFLRFKVSTLNGSEVQNKGMALFPRKINGRYAMISRQDGENMYLMFSDDIYFWNQKRLLAKPTYTWEYVQLGNCGSPIETNKGWIVLTHGVGAMRKYAIGAILLDRDDPSKVLGRTKLPIIEPIESEREGYVPNVVYSCGGALLGQTLIIPYAMSDYASSFAYMNLDDLFKALS